MTGSAELWNISPATFSPLQHFAIKVRHTNRTARTLLSAYSHRDKNKGLASTFDESKG